MSLPTVLQRIIADTRRDLAARSVDLAKLKAQARATPPAPDAWSSLSTPGVRIIAEVKRRSPSAGDIQSAADPVAIARAYAEAGAAAISVLTEPHHFGGALADLQAVSEAVAIPRLRKDFIIDRRQILEARVAGASLVLLLASVLDARELRDLREAAEVLGMHALVEAHDAAEVARSVRSGARIIGVNNRDLHTFDVDLQTCERLRSQIPAGIIAVAESGIAHRADIDRLRGRGYDVFLIGTSLMAAPSPGAALAALLDQTQTR